MVSPTKWNMSTNYKRRIEDSLEKYRPSEFPRRDKCLYVCFSKENAYEWASYKYRRRNVSYKLLTLEVSGELYWLMSDSYNFLQENCSQEELERASKQYWESPLEDNDALVIDKGVEGLFCGEARITAIENKNFINGESFDVE